MHVTYIRNSIVTIRRLIITDKLKQIVVVGFSRGMQVLSDSPHSCSRVVYSPGTCLSHGRLQSQIQSARCDKISTLYTDVI